MDEDAAIRMALVVASTPALPLHINGRCEYRKAKYGDVCKFRIMEDKPIWTLLESIKAEDPQTTTLHFWETIEPTSDGNIRLAKSTISSDIINICIKRGGILLQRNDEFIKISPQSLEDRLKPLQVELEKVDLDIKPLVAKKKLLDAQALRSATMTNWAGFTALCAQFGIMARLTWWEYSWDVMEPISYILSVGTGIIAYYFY
ncbi:hypothetical protein HDU76_006814, partial [Blyttiomyces sp. JEL0837]